MRRPKRKRVPKRIWKITARGQHGLCACSCRGRIFQSDYPASVTIDHDPPLAMRLLNDDGSDYDPPQLDPAHLRVFLRGHDRQKTYGTPVTSKDGDISKIAATKRTKAKHDTHLAVMKAKAGQ